MMIVCRMIITYCCTVYNFGMTVYYMNCNKISRVATAATARACGERYVPTVYTRVRRNGRETEDD